MLLSNQTGGLGGAVTGGLEGGAVGGLGAGDLGAFDEGGLGPDIEKLHGHCRSEENFNQRRRFPEIHSTTAR
jgi:hypothetical protein